VDLKDSGYHELVLEKLLSADVNIGDTIEISHDDTTFSGILMPRSQIGSDPYHIVIKLINGYNVGLKLNQNSTIRKVSSAKRKRKKLDLPLENNQDLPNIAILSTGGTIASRVDYQTGAVTPALSAQDLYNAVPELRDYANIHAKIVMSTLSENIHPQQWTKIAKSIATEIRKGIDGVVVAHGTDTLGFTAAALSFSLQNLPVPVVLVGSQRSSDRPSSDAAVNLIGATDIVSRADAAEVMVVMHGETSDTFLYAHRGTRVRKLHTSRRDAFQSINESPLFRLNDDNIEEISPPLARRDQKRKLSIKPNFDENVALIKTHPGLSERLFNNYIDSNLNGIIIEGTGLGHAPDAIHSAIKRALDSDIIVAMTSQCIFGRIDMNVYRTGVELLDMGVIPCEDILPETALVKLMWLLANTKTKEKARELLPISLVGEVSKRSEQSEYKNLGSLSK
jgi:glutamyl-tRNA(Gln) amidotransferase subunit D